MPKLLDWIKNMGGVFNHISLFNVSFFKGVKEQIEMILKNCTGDDLIDYKIYGNNTQKSTTGKNLFSGNYSQFDSSGGTGNLYSYFKLPEDNETYTLTLIAKNDFPATPNVYIGFTGNGGDAQNGFMWVLSPANSVTKGQKLTYSSNSLRYISLYYSNASTLKTITDNFYVILEKSNSFTSYEEYTGGQPSPNPSYPQEIKSVGDLVTEGEYEGKYKIPVIIKGKNHINNVGATGEFYGIDYKNKGNGTTSVAGTATGDFYYYIFGNSNNRPITLKAGTYILSGGISSNAWIRLQDSNGNVYDDTGNSKTITLNQETSFSCIARIRNGTTINGIFKPMLRAIDTNDNFEKYMSPITTNIYLDAPLIKIGDIADYINFESQKVVRNIGEIVLNGSEDWVKNTWVNQPDVYAFQLSNVITNMHEYQANIVNYLCDKFVCVISSQWGSNTEHIVQMANNTMLITINKSRLEDYDIELFKIWLSTHNTELVYQLATPTEETVELPEIPTFEGTTIIEVETETQPSNMWVKYYSN